MFDSIIGKGFTNKETPSPDYFLGGYFERVKEPNTDNEILTWVSKTYVKIMMENFKNTYVFDPPKQHSAMPPEYKPDIDTTDLYNDPEKDKYWKCVGDMQWSVTSGCIYIMYATVVLSRYLPATHKVCLSKIQRLYGYLKKYTSTSINFNT